VSPYTTKWSLDAPSQSAWAVVEATSSDRIHNDLRMKGPSHTTAQSNESKNNGVALAMQQGCALGAAYPAIALAGVYRIVLSSYGLEESALLSLSAAASGDSKTLASVFVSLLKAVAKISEVDLGARPRGRSGQDHAMLGQGKSHPSRYWVCQRSGLVVETVMLRCFPDISFAPNLQRQFLCMTS